MCVSGGLKARENTSLVKSKRETWQTNGLNLVTAATQVQASKEPSDWLALRDKAGRSHEVTCCVVLRKQEVPLV